ncbi:MAG: OmpA family protein [Bacteroidota bacterium]|nr:OmpA family protein [Bacteroidota bacterium]
MMKGCVVIVFLAALPMLLAGQERIEFPGRPRYAEGLLAVQAGGGFTKYSGEFNDESLGGMGLFRASYALIPEFSVGLQGVFGNLAYQRRRRRNMEYSYEFQFGKENYILRRTTISSFHLFAQLNFFPRAYINGTFYTGCGVTLYDPEDYAKELVAVRPQAEDLAALSVPVGIGAEWFLFRSISVGLDFSYTFVFTDRLDAFPPAELREEYLKRYGSILGDPSMTEGNDGYFSLAAGVKIYLLEDNDIDGDLLSNEREEREGTNPYDQDTDGDGLSDYEEIMVNRTDPRKKDTDGDGLTDYAEIMRTRTNPLQADTDGDGLADAEELQHFTTDPLRKDTDEDGLEDGREVRLGTSPIRFDTDGDNLDDVAEIEVSHTDPRVYDTDGDGLSDFIEFRAHRTDPTKADTDGDGLRDGEEVVEYRTNPLEKDTDGDTLDDFTEIRTRGTDPLNRDTDGDGITDDRDTCPLIAETYNGFQDEDGCEDAAPGEVARKSKPVIAARGVTIERMDTVRIYEGKVLTLFGVNFEVDKDVIRPESYPILEEDARLFSLYPGLTVEIRGHTDSDASEEYNLDLSERRAKAVRDFLVRLGVDPSRMTVKGYGESMPIAPNTDPIGKARNRRIEFFITSTGMKAAHGRDPRTIDTTKQILDER